MNVSRAITFILAALVSAPYAAGQQSIDLGSISGRVTDPSGGVVANAHVIVRQLETNVTSTAMTDGEGRFRLTNLRVGPYEITVKSEGFADLSQRISVSAGAAFELPLTLPVAGVNAALTVSADATVIESARSQIATTVGVSEIQALPMNGRNFLDLALLAPGVSPTNVASTQLFPETSAVPGISLSVASQRNLSNSFVVDGVSANDDAAGLSGMTFGIDAIEQLQVVTSGAQAELGRALGGYVNVVTRSGTNTPRGTAYAFFRDDRLNAENPLLRAKLPMSQQQYGGSAGGPIIVDRSFYFANVEQRRLDQTGLTTISRASVDTINARLAAVGYAGPQIETGVYPNPVKSTNVLGKVDHEFGGRDRLTVRYSLYDVAADNARGAGGLNAPSASSRLDNRDHALALTNTLTLSSRTLLETRAQIVHSDLEAPPTATAGPAVAIAGVASFGTSSNSPTARVNTLYQLVNSVSHQLSAHAIRGGLDVLYNDDAITFPRSVRGAYTFSSLPNFLSGVYNTNGFTQTFGTSNVSITNPNVGMYLQDEWRAGSQVTLNLGLRYDLQFLETIQTDTNNISPRLGIAWTPGAARRTVVRGSAGLFYDRVPLRALANALLSAGNTTDLANLRQVNVSLSPSQAGAPTFPQSLSAAIASGTLPNLTTMDRHLQNASSQQASVELERQIAQRATFSVGYHYLRGRDLLMAINQNVPTCPATGTNNGCRPNSTYANNSQYSSAGESNYHGLHVSLAQRAAQWGHYRVSYTFSKSMNNLGEFFFSSSIDPADLSKDWGRSDDDQRHRLVVSGALQTSMAPATSVSTYLFNGFQLSGSMQAYSALPLNVLSGVTTIQGTAARPIVNGEFIPRNADVGNDHFTVSLRLSRTFPLGRRVRLEAFAEGFNVTNKQNVVTRNTNFGPGAYPDNPLPTFGQVTAVGEPRSFQLGGRIRF